MNEFEKNLLLEIKRLYEFVSFVLRNYPEILIEFSKELQENAEVQEEDNPTDGL